MYSANRERSSRKRSLEFDRIDVLSLLYKHFKEQARRIDKRHCTKRDKERDYQVQNLNALGKTLLYGLKDEDLETRIIELEEKLKGAVIIPDGSEQQKTKRA